MTARQFLNWKAYEEVEPFGERRDDLRTAYLAHLYYSVHKKKDAPKVDVRAMLGDFLASIKDKEPLTPQQFEAKWKAEKAMLVGQMKAIAAASKRRKQQRIERQQRQAARRALKEITHGKRKGASRVRARRS